MRTKQNPLHPAGPGASPSRQPLAKLKAERVQLQARLASRRARARRGQARVRGLPEWYAVGGSLGRQRVLANPSAAAAYANYVLQAAAHAGQSVAVELAGSGVTVAVRGSSRRGLTKAVRDFARALA